ncbi:MAG: hypothetical protein GF315_10120 [candidate division Zixibacteria bacterium]|nr:hypothetical protein [candidate division Zixibacteria bacterium]
MKNKTKKSKEKTSKPHDSKDEISYLTEEVKNFEFADHVAIRSYPRGMLLSFSKAHPGEEKLLTFKEILIPFEVAVSLQQIIKDQIDGLIEQGILKSVDSSKFKDEEQ